MTMSLEILEKSLPHSGAVPTNLVDDETPTTPMAGDNPVPDFEGQAATLRPLYDNLRKHDTTGKRRRFEALAATRQLLRDARDHAGDFRRLSRSRHNIRGNGRIETVLLKWFWRDDTKGDSNINRLADVLGWMTYMQADPEMSSSDIVSVALELGTTKISALYRASHGGAEKPTPEPVPLLEYADNILEDREPAALEPLFERATEDSVEMAVIRKKPGCHPELYPISGNEKLIRVALKSL